MKLPNDKQQAIAELATALRESVGPPLDKWAVTALLEAKGLRDADAQEQFNYNDLFEFAEDVYRHAYELKTGMDQENEAPPSWSFRKFLKHLWQGSFFAMPMLGQIACVLLTRYSLWASLDFTELQATVVGLGTLASFSVTGGLVMCIGRQGTVYKGLKAFHLLRQICGRLSVVGMLMALGVAMSMTLIQLVSPLVGFGAFCIAAAYYGALCALWIALAILYMLAKHQYSFALTLAGGLLVAILVRWFGVPVYAAQVLSISLTAVAAFVVALRSLDAMLEDEDPRYVAARLPPGDALVGVLTPFFAYGACYFSLLFADRVMAWTAPGRALPQPIWFHTPYELGMDWGLISLLVPMAYLEHVVNEFGPRLEREQKRLSHKRLGLHRSSFSSFVGFSLVVLLVFSVLSVVLTYLGVIALRRFEEVDSIRDFFASPITFEVYWASAVAYQLLTMGLMIGLMYFTLGRQEVVLRTMARALVASVVVGFFASRLVTPHWAVAGFVAGTGCFVFSMLWACWRLGRNIDHIYYSAY